MIECILVFLYGTVWDTFISQYYKLPNLPLTLIKHDHNQTPCRPCPIGRTTLCTILRPISQLDYLIERRNAERAREDFVKSMKKPKHQIYQLMKSQNEQRRLHEMQKQELDRYLARFFMIA
ncbi:hypothetical protein KUTeg_011242 [Tegillarca granosa]|uniref:Uncharacterized protein n=1 Tax=Tegillarca granosa TaxID=220873 RepID=A0ABQ9F1D1_TEGGR|nr:hypothetical protein KUTeg_011242 [Tegillarca granosa]